MAIPPDPILRAAARWLERLPLSSAARCRALFTNHDDFGDITPTQYDAAYAWLSEAGLLSAGLDLQPAISIFTAASADAGWFADADVLISGPDELPADAARAARTLGLDEDSAYALIVGNWSKVDTARRERVGAAGEIALLHLLKTGIDATLEHVAAFSDGYGYDIAVHSRDVTAHLEVKSTLRKGRLTIYLSRNEFETMRRDPAWHLVAVRLDEDLALASIATVKSDFLLAASPRDCGVHGRWGMCKFDVPAEALRPGIPSVEAALRGDAPTLLSQPSTW